MAEESDGTGSDLELRRRILDGLAASGELVKLYKQPLERILLSKVQRDDGLSREKAVEIAAKVVGDCFRASPSLLEKWDGSGSLAGFLNTSGENALKSWWRSPDFKRRAGELKEQGDSDGPCTPLPPLPPPEEGVEEAEILRAMAGLRAGVTSAEAEAPEGLAFLRLKGLHGVNQRTIARCWGVNEAQITRRIDKAMETIHGTARTFALAGGEELPYAAFQQALRRDPVILLGHCGDSGAPLEDALVAAAAGGGAEKKTLLAAARAMCRDHRNLALFAGLLNRETGKGPAVAKDPELDGMAARLGECVRRTVDLLRPADAAALVTPLMSAAFADTLSLIGADGGTLWLLAPGEAVLEGVFNPCEPELAGQRQPLVSGIVSLVLATGEAACIADVSSHGQHSPAIDMALGKTTRAMIAVPFQIGGAVRGVVTAVRLGSAGGFAGRETQILERHAEIMAGLLTRALEARILEVRSTRKKTPASGD